LLKGQDLIKKTDKEMNKIRGKDMAMIFQEPMTALNPVFTIGSQLQEVLFNHLDISKKEARSKDIHLLRQVGISRPEKVVDEYPHQLSVGMRKRVIIEIDIVIMLKLLITDDSMSIVCYSVNI